MNNTSCHRLTAQEHATVLAALRYYQRQGLADDSDLRPAEIHDIATGGDRACFAASLDAAGIDALCERLNTTEEEMDAADPAGAPGKINHRCLSDFEEAAGAALRKRSATPETPAA
ncbi:hypothetical protein OH491_24710 [Termitidicoccus mucosus]